MQMTEFVTCESEIQHEYNVKEKHDPNHQDSLIVSFSKYMKETADVLFSL